MKNEQSRYSGMGNVKNTLVLIGFKTDNVENPTGFYKVLEGTRGTTTKDQDPVPIESAQPNASV